MINAILGDITTVSADAIVNAANETLLGGGGVDGAIHRAAGPELLDACKKLGGCKTGQAKITVGFNLPAKYVIHTVGPIWKGGEHQEKDLLTSCYISSLELAVCNQIKSIAFPAISTGVYRFPKELAAEIAINTISRFLQKGSGPEVTLVSFCSDNHNLYLDILEKPSG